MGETWKIIPEDVPSLHSILHSIKSVSVLKWQIDKGVFIEDSKKSGGGRRADCTVVIKCRFKDLIT